MPPQKKRLPRVEFQTRGYRTSATPFFSLKTRLNEAQGLRIGVIVGKNVHKTAAKRNFWKRQARTALASLVKENRDIILIFHPRVNELTKRVFRETLKKYV